MDFTYIDKNVAEIRDRMNSARGASGGKRDVTLVAAVKYASTEEINYLCMHAGVRDIGENRVQQLLEHYEGLEDKSVRLHFIGTLQTNKVKYIVDKVCMIHSVDSERLALEIDRQASKRGRVVDVLVEINSGEEESKSGVLAGDAESLCRAVDALQNVRLCGFMTMAPRCENREDYKKYFCATRALARDIWNALGKDGEPLMSMGMSESFCEAIECGADIVRVGRGLFVK